jgi:hypothetical protein
VAQEGRLRHERPGVAYRVIETLNARNEITDLKLLYEIRARGAGADNGFASTSRA